MTDKKKIMITTEEITLKPIGMVHCRLRTATEAPKNYAESTETGRLEIFPPYREAMLGIAAGQTIMVLFWLHQAPRNILKVYPRGDRRRGLHGVFATRSPARPNPVAVSELTVLAVQDDGIAVAGLDVLDGTPVLDIKSSLTAGKSE